MNRQDKRLVREQLSHGRGDRRVTIHGGGSVTYTGNTDPYTRAPGRRWGGYAKDLLREAKALEQLCRECGCSLDADGACGSTVDVYGTPCGRAE